MLRHYERKWRMKKNYAYIDRFIQKHRIAGRVLDLPAGTGAKADPLRQFGIEVYSADICPQRFQIKGLKCQYVDMNLPLPYEDGFFDGIWCAEGIEHIENQFGFMRECFRILKPRGKIIITTPNLLYLWARVYYLLTGYHGPKEKFPAELTRRIDGGHINLLSYPKLRYILANNGFSIIEVNSVNLSRNSLIWFWIIPLMYLTSYAKHIIEKNPEKRKRETLIRQDTFSLPLLFCKKLILIAEKT
ncbi:MAG: class I SAM-dependent methyltransferase [Planctomycetota bacterium]|nr:class I SAM-dependent methyltransferase [Planctomycetota bacterium]MDI6788128.1 class I SAM-dependent methyltransferase [Planctomycetota bacterium]